MAEEFPFGALLRQFRSAADLTLEQLARASGVSDRAISDMERGVSRGPRVRTVEAIADGLALAGDDRVALLAAARDGRGAAGTPTASGLPPPRRVDDFTGRTAELAQVAEWLGGATAGTPSPVVMISGAPGVGKTSFAVRAALLHGPEEQLFLDLRGLDAEPLTPVAVLHRLIRAISPELRVVPRDTDEAAALWHTLIQGRPRVLVLDNAISESQVRRALPPRGPATVLITSRRTLGGLEGVRRLRLDPLPEDDAVALLAAIVEQGTAAPEASLRRIAELCVNVPLALRIAGNRLVSRPGWTVDDLIARLGAEERRIDALTAGDLQIRAAFTLSYQQLSAEARRLFRRLALVPGSSTGVELASVLAEEPVPVTEEALDELVDLSLLEQRADGRLAFHDLLRLYAEGELSREEAAADRAAAGRRRDDWLLDTAVAAGRCFEPGHGLTAAKAATVVEITSSDEADAWLRAEAENWLPALHQAATEGEDQRVIDVAESLHWYSDSWPMWPHWTEVFGLSTRAAERLADDRLRAEHLGYLAWVQIVCLNKPEEGLEYAREALDSAVRSGDRRQIGWAAYYVGWALSLQERWPEVIEYASRAEDDLRAADDREGVPNSLILRGLGLHGAGRFDEAIPVFERAIVRLTDPATAPPEYIAKFAEVTARAFLADLEIDLKRWPAALARCSDGIAAVERSGEASVRMIAALSRRALVHAHLGDAAAAQADLASLRALQEKAGEAATVTGRIAERVAEVERLAARHR
ncbi:transcriptional regulator with XRE-family HTH domain/tetratricopeptide (TPR) repeat protein [Actinoplanes tereljensis]|uniref:HTH cro/C1-type domain-containing protein n=1 Tax=Paractinoplanes tereljensis TaxID=571912 RepID=A0A919NTS3_9ACTN|nr:helix-turn-helix domain-containing protein [Actinoplanes tereljensis]GIF23804.1 hypothetical protein Ate02nite_65340 [Actinoplanes tereljensis]